MYIYMKWLKMPVIEMPFSAHYYNLWNPFYSSQLFEVFVKYVNGFNAWLMRQKLINYTVNFNACSFVWLSKSILENCVKLNRFDVWMLNDSV